MNTKKKGGKFKEFVVYHNDPKENLTSVGPVKCPA
jgi:hypothetical protein